ncbi:LysR family transcriptional regulator [Acidicapsa ligni]|uniref:LysR family transcriptional regulator n=1 Tax=Acidicapsa ligni TaxID=542300 RepID=UPI0021DF9455|nr:LysR family transcriptional regulator [Acidicapsa ligni]
MELRHFRYFVAVAEHGSFSGAARTLRVAQSAISEQLTNMEREIGVAMFLRSTRRTALTSAGELFLIEARRVLAAADHAIEVAQQTHRGELGTLRIGFFAGGMGVDFPSLIQTFRKKYPGVRLSLVEMISTLQWVALREGKIDVGFSRRLEPEFRSDLKSEVIQQDAIVAILPKNHPILKGSKPGSPCRIDLRDLANEPFVLSSRETSPAVFDKVIELCSEAGFSPRIASISSVWSSVVLMVQAGEGISLLPLNQQQFRTPDLAFCPLKAKNAFVEFVMTWHTKRDSNLIRSFRELVRQRSVR